MIERIGGGASPIRNYPAIAGSRGVLMAPAPKPAAWRIAHPWLGWWRLGWSRLGWSRLETGSRYQQNCTECHKAKARPVRSEPQESQAAPWRLQSIASGPRGIPSTKRSPPNSGACHVQDSTDDEERAKSHQEHSRLLFVAAPHNTTGVKHPGSKSFRPRAVIQSCIPDEPTGRVRAR